VTLENGFLTDLSLLCFVCADLDETVRRCATELGIGPWDVYDFAPPRLFDTEISGAPAPYRMRVAFSAVGGMGWSLLEPTGGASIYADFLKRRGPGLHHVAFLHEPLSYADCIREFGRRGYAVVQKGNYCGRFCYLDTRERAHLVFELIEDHDATMLDRLYRFPEESDGAGAAPLFDRTVSAGLVTGDLSRSLALYAGELGIGPWSVEERVSPVIARRATAQIGRYLWELVEPGEGASAYRERLDAKGASAHSIGVSGSDYEGTLARLRARHIDIAPADGANGRAAYLATEDILGVRLKLFEREPGVSSAGTRYPG
jgi:hypothetical protein